MSQFKNELTGFSGHHTITDTNLHTFRTGHMAMIIECIEDTIIESISYASWFNADGNDITAITLPAGFRFYTRAATLKLTSGKVECYLTKDI